MSRAAGIMLPLCGGIALLLVLPLPRAGGQEPATPGRPAAATAAAPAAAGSPVSERAILERATRRKVLDNGLQLVVVENHGVPLATVEIDVRNGSFTQSPEYAGLAHMYEHMFFKANQTYPEPDAFVDRAGDLGAVFNGTTKEESVSYYLTLPSDSVAAGLHFMAAALRGPLFLPSELAREKEVVLGEYDRQEASPFFQMTQTMDQKLYPGNWSRKNVIGDRDVVRHVTPEQMREIQHRYYVPNNSALIVTGDVNADHVFALAQEIFGDWPRQADPFVAYPIPPIPPLTGSQAVIAEAPVGAVTVLIEWQGPSVRSDPASTYAADVFSDAVNQPVSAFQQHLVDSGLFQDIGVNYYTLDHTGPISISGQTTPGKLRAALAALDKEIARFDSIGYVTPEQLTEVKAQRAVNSAFGRERASGYAHTVGFWWSVASIEYYLGYVDNMAGQTNADLAAYAHKYIVGKPRVTGIVISPADRKAINLTEADLTGGVQ
jgi:zinc protease